MPLRHYRRAFFIDPDKFEHSDLLISARQKMGSDLYDLAFHVFTTFIAHQDAERSAGFFKFAFIVGEQSAQHFPDVKALWNGMLHAYGRGDAADDAIHRILGTICMICVARDPRRWVYVEDEDKHQKLACDKIPEPNQYFIGQYRMPRKRRKYA